MPAQELWMIPITWPFAVWGLDMVGTFKTARGGLTHLLVAVSLELSSVVFPLRKAKKFYVKFTRGIVVIMPAQSPLWPRLFVMVFIG